MLQAETFYQKTGKPFTYAISGGCVVPSTTNRQLARSQFARAYERVPLRGPGELQDLQGPSYLFAILADARVAAGVHVAAGAAGAVTPRQEAFGRTAPDCRPLGHGSIKDPLRRWPGKFSQQIPVPSRCRGR